MLKIDTTSTLAELVDVHPEFARQFERRGLDYCCGGARTLADACAERGLDPNSVAEELGIFAAVPTRPAWREMDAVALVEHLETTHHRYLHEELPRLSVLATKVLGVHGDHHPELRHITSTYEAIRADLEPHLMKEERVLFPMIRELADAADAPDFHCGTLRNPISVMMREHEVVGDLLAELRRATDGYRTPADGCASYTALFAGLEALELDTHLHVHKENNVLFPMVVSMEAQLAGR